MRLSIFATSLLLNLGVVSCSFIEATNNGTTLVIAAERSVQINNTLIVNGTVTVSSMDLLAKIQEIRNTIAVLNASLTSCTLFPCINGGSCNGGVCTCATGFTGSLCQIKINECSSSPCTNNGTCMNSNGFFTCSCAAGFTGSRCETNVDECASSPCSNGATCSQQLATPNQFACLCAVGFTGYACQTDIDDCQIQPCLNGGTCSTPTIGEFTCNCVFGFVGKICAVACINPIGNIQAVNGTGVNSWLYHNATVVATSTSTLIGFYVAGSTNRFVYIDSVFFGEVSASPSNLVENPGFETGDISPWSTPCDNTCSSGGPAISTSVVLAGSYAYSASCTNSGFLLSQSISTQIGKTYLLSYHYNLPNTQVELRVVCH